MIKNYSYYKYTILVLETQYFSCCLLHFSNSYLSIYLKTKQKKPAKQISKQDKTKKKKKRKKGKRRSIAGFELGTFGLTRSHIATTPLRMATLLAKSLKLNPFSMELPPANDRGKRSSHKNDSKQWDEIKAN